MLGAASCAAPGAWEVGSPLPGPAPLHPEAIPWAGAAHRVSPSARNHAWAVGYVPWDAKACDEAGRPVARAWGATGHCTGPQGRPQALRGHPDTVLEGEPRGTLQILTQRPRGEQGRKAMAMKAQARR